MKFKIRSILLFTLFVFLFIFLISYLAIPQEIYVVAGKDYDLNLKSPMHTKVSTDPNIITNGEYNFETPLSIKAVKTGDFNIQFDILGFLPIKRTNINVRKEILVYPSGQSCGVKILTEGVLVIATGNATDKNGNFHSPAKEAGILAGDFIKSVNGEKIKNTNHLSSIVNKNKDKPLEIVFEREGNTKTAIITPISCDNSNFVLGMWVRDSTAGLGTLTFYSSDKKKFGALGHSITDIDTGELMTVKEGDLVKSSIISLSKGGKGKPGELLGIFDEPSTKIGTITANTNYGLYGDVKNADIIPDIKPIPIALRNELKTGKAKILSTISDNKVESFDVEIIKINNQQNESIKSLILKVTDPDLIERTGGIIQGMSGSPIIQDGKLVGAVTHVFVNDPLKGYGIFIEWMSNEMDKY